ncbi:FAD-binding oxidoreductase [bacterium M00.F.Ca.ET.194.01.1.1]|nr:FAD-binding oxidoreductase [bacterium M00.F.Ca.ET.194.01.1.1]TGS52332.1 FAD-binding oxidoreductase [bacterium M00.F.Ca.ET.179.01.1.1]TGV44193.1 FAD-binding oxidoreductase [bacterium M00.F.Ca.ET.168.01.1.1]
MLSSDEHVRNLRSMLGEKGVLVGGDTAGYELGARFDKGLAAFVLRPASTTEVSAAVAYCVQNQIHIVAQGNNTGVVSGSTPDPSGRQAVLSLDRLNRKLSIDIDNRSATVDAGYLLSQVNSALEPHGLFFPIDLGADPRLGGMLATNTGGARFLKYGDVRKNTLGLKVVLADAQGTIVDLSSPLRKNNTGVDWKQIFIGTCGAFGIITECVLNLEPLPVQTATALLVPESFEKVMPLLHLLERNFGAYLSAFEGISGSALKGTLARIPGLRNPFSHGDLPEYVILMELNRTWLPREEEQSLDAALEAVLAEAWEAEDELLADALIVPAQDAWALRHAIPEGVKEMGKLVACDLSFRRGDVMKFCRHMKSEIKTRFPDVEVCEFGHIGDGGIHFNLVADPTSSLAMDPTFESQIREWVYDEAVRFGGSFSAEHGIGRKNQIYYDKFTPAQFRQWASSLKRVTSPGGLGTVVFG